MRPVRHNLAFIVVAALLCGFASQLWHLRYDTAMGLWLAATLASLVCFARMGPGRPGKPRASRSLTPTLEGWRLRPRARLRGTYASWVLIGLALIAFAPTAAAIQDMIRLDSMWGGCANSYDPLRRWCSTLVVLGAPGLGGLGAVLTAFDARPGPPIDRVGRVLRVGSRSVVLDGTHRISIHPGGERLAIHSGPNTLVIRGHRDELRWIADDLLTLRPRSLPLASNTAPTGLLLSQRCRRV